jgi:predicted nucleic acid-binding protein
MVLVDSSVWIEAARRDGDLECKVALQALLEVYEATLSSPVRLEVLGGAGPAERQRLEQYFAALPSCSIEEADWEAAVRNSWKLRDAGLTIPYNDILVATLALRQRCRVYAKDAHFEAMSRVLGIELYRPGPGGTYSPQPAAGGLE